MKAENQYTVRINRVLDHIESHISEDLTLEELSAVSCFSKYHFNRIFSAMMNETLFQFIQRLRMQKAAALLVSNVDEPVTEVALSVGFSTPSSFAKCFKLHFGMSASEFRRLYDTKSNLGQVYSNLRPRESKWREEIEAIRMYTEYHNSHTVWRYEMETKHIKVEVVRVEEMNVAYVRHVGPYAGDSELFGRLFSKIFTWGGARGLINFPETKMLCIYHDDPGMTEESKLRTSVCITVPPETEVSGEIGKMSIPGGLYAIGHFEVGADEFAEAWSFLCGTWLSQSGYEPADGVPFELYLNDAKSHPQGKFLVDIYVPVKPMR